MKHSTGTLFIFVVVALAACGAGSRAEGQSHLSGTITVRAEVDSTKDYRGFQVLVLNNIQTELDTLGVAETDLEGRFATSVRVPETGIYRMVILRNDEILSVEQLVLADGDSARVQAVYPLEGRPVRIVSRENAAWMAYRNTKAQYNRLVMEGAQSGTYSEAAMARTVGQTSAIFWSLRDTYAGTMGAGIASAESVVMLEGWNDSLAIVRAREIAPGQPNRIDAARTARRASARLAGQDSALAALSWFERGAAADELAALAAERVVAHMDSLEQSRALAAARTLMQDHRDTPWARWAERAIYELENLQPGMTAPGISLLDRDGEGFDLDDYRDQFLLLEFYAPTNTVFAQESSAREAFIRGIDQAVLAVVSVSVEPDSVVNAALFDGRTLSGRFVFEPDGLRGVAATTYNVNVLPTRFLIGPDGRILAKYVGPAMPTIREDVLAILSRLNR